MTTIREAIKKFKQEYNSNNEEHRQVMTAIVTLENFKWEKIYEFVEELKK